jgi:hypothetical protein
VNVKRFVLSTAVAAAALGLGLAAASPASAAPQTQTINCGRTLLTIRTPTDNSSDQGGWSVGQIVSGGTGHLIPTSFTFSAYDSTTGTTLFDGTTTKGGGHANANQPQISCSQTMTGTLADLLSPGETPPPGAALTDTVTSSFTVTAVPRP